MAAAVIAVAAAICIFGPPSLARAATVVPSSASPVPNATSRTSHVWAGWMDLANKGVQFQSVAARFTVPKVTCTAKGEEVDFWVGLDGWTDRTVEQAGVDAFCDIHTGSGYKPEYTDWYEMFPHLPVTEHRVSPGDTIVVSVSHNSSGRTYLLEVDDRTHPANGFNISASCPSGHTCLNNSAEVIAEDPGGGPPKHVFLPNFGTVHFSEVQVISRSGTIGSLGGNSLWSANEITMEYPGKTVMAKPSARTSRDTAFSVTYHSKG
jgi:hypothetical protein